MEWNVVAAFVLGIFLVAIFVKVFFVPIKYLLRLVINGVVGGLLLLFFNAFGSMVGITIPINPVTAIVSGFLGIPGVILLIILQLVMIY